MLTVWRGVDCFHHPLHQPAAVAPHVSLHSARVHHAGLCMGQGGRFWTAVVAQRACRQHSRGAHAPSCACRRQLELQLPHAQLSSACSVRRQPAALGACAPARRALPGGAAARSQTGSWPAWCSAAPRRKQQVAIGGAGGQNRQAACAAWRRHAGRLPGVRSVQAPSPVLEKWRREGGPELPGRHPPSRSGQSRRAETQLAGGLGGCTGRQSGA